MICGVDLKSPAWQDLHAQGPWRSWSASRSATNRPSVLTTLPNPFQTQHQSARPSGHGSLVVLMLKHLKVRPQVRRQPRGRPVVATVSNVGASGVAVCCPTQVAGRLYKRWRTKHAASVGQTLLDLGWLCSGICPSATLDADKLNIIVTPTRQAMMSRCSFWLFVTEPARLTSTAAKWVHPNKKLPQKR